MGVIYSYYDQKRHVEFDMGKWYGWSDDGVAVAKLFLPRDRLVEDLAAYMREGHFDVEDVEGYAAWLADKLVEFRADAAPEDFRWINDSDDSDDVTFRCGKCGNDEFDCKCTVPQRCKTIGSRYVSEYDDAGRYELQDSGTEEGMTERPKTSLRELRSLLLAPPPLEGLVRGYLDFGDETSTPRPWPLLALDTIKPFSVAPGAEVRRRLVMHRVFRGNQLWITSTGPVVSLESLRVGVIENLLDPVPAHFFDPIAMGIRLEIPTADRGQMIELVFRGAEELAVLRCVLFGTYLERGDE